ncbi:MAG TPA: DUF4908 domain-containing protein [Micropepsaceae bacterium]|nr:DUF4908 domain-containing protein [Micropepsaceae bacterium]
MSDRLRLQLAVAVVWALAFAGPDALAQQAAPPARLLLTPSAPLPHDGTYIANDKVAFTVDHRDGQVRLRFLDDDEVFYLSSEPAPMGGRVLKYDTGAVALQVTGWGGLTLYTMEARNGLPAELNEAIQSVDPPPVDAKQVKAFAAKLAEDLSAAEDFAVGFAADWDNLAQSDELRSLGCDAMRNVAYALKQLGKSGRRARLSERIHIIRVIRGTKPGVTMQKGILAVTIAPQEGPSARPSSLAIEQAIEAAL